MVTEKNAEMDDDLSEQPGSVTHDFGEHTVTVSTITDEDMGRDFLTCTHPTQVRAKLQWKIDCRSWSKLGL